MILHNNESLEDKMNKFLEITTNPSQYYSLALIPEYSVPLPVTEKLLTVFMNNKEFKNIIDCKNCHYKCSTSKINEFLESLDYRSRNSKEFRLK